MSPKYLNDHETRKCMHTNIQTVIHVILEQDVQNCQTCYSQNYCIPGCDRV